MSDGTRKFITVSIISVVLIVIALFIWVNRSVLTKGVVMRKDHHAAYYTYDSESVYDSKGNKIGETSVPRYHPERWVLAVKGEYEGKPRTEWWDVSADVFYTVREGEHVRKEDGWITIAEG